MDDDLWKGWREAFVQRSRTKEKGLAGQTNNSVSIMVPLIPYEVMRHGSLKIGLVL